MSPRFLVAVCALGILSMVSICFLGCSSARVADTAAPAVIDGTVAPGMDSVFTEALNHFSSREVSNANNYVCGGLYSLKDAQAQDAGSAVVLEAAEAASWAVYGWSGLSIDNLPVKVSYELADVTTEYWIGIGNYSTSNWEFQGPFTVDTTEVEFTSSADYVSTSGVATIAIVVAGGHQATVRWVNLVTSLASDRIYVDADHTGVEDGTYEFPFNTITEGIAAADSGQVVVLAPGQYDVIENITVDKPLTFEGAGAGCTTVTGGFLIDVPDTETGSAAFNGLNCHFVHFADTPGDKVPIRIQHCAVLGLFVAYPANHDIAIENSVIIGDEDDDGSIAVIGDVWDVSDGIVVSFNHLEGTALNTVSSCSINGDLNGNRWLIWCNYTHCPAGLWTRSCSILFNHFNHCY